MVGENEQLKIFMLPISWILKKITRIISVKKIKLNKGWYRALHSLEGAIFLF